MENLTICFMHQPLILEDLLVDTEFQEFIVNMILVCSSQFVRQVSQSGAEFRSRGLRTTNQELSLGHVVRYARLFSSVLSSVETC